MEVECKELEGLDGEGGSHTGWTTSLSSSNYERLALILESSICNIRKGHKSISKVYPVNLTSLHLTKFHLLQSGHLQLLGAWNSTLQTRINTDKPSNVDIDAPNHYLARCTSGCTT